MMNSEISNLSPLFPPGYRRDFDAHIYYTAETRSRAARLRQRALELFTPNMPVFVGNLVDRPIGPHPIPMFELCFPKESLGEILNWLFRERAGLTVLVHAVTGNDPWDHSEGAVWLGTPVELDVSKLDP